MEQRDKNIVCYYCRKKLEPSSHINEGLHSDCFCRWFQVPYAQSFEDLAARNTEESDNEWNKVVSSFFHGKFRKYSARLQKKHYLIKVQQLEVPELPATEYLCNQIAKLLGLEVPPFFLIRLNNELDAFVSENFVAKLPSSNLIHIYRFLKRPEEYTFEGLLTVIQNETGRYEDMARFVHLCLFDSLIGNHDRHGRNLALLQTPSLIRLAPFYDNPTYLAIEIPFLLGAQHEPRGAIPTQESIDPTMQDYIRECIRLGFENEVAKFFKQIDVEAIKSLIQNSFISVKRQEAILRLIYKRYEVLQYAIS